MIFKNVIKCFFLITTIFSFSINLIAQNITIRTEKADATYRSGQTANFIVNSDVSDTYSYEIFFDADGNNINPYNTIVTGSIEIQSGTEVSIPFKLDEPGLISCRINGLHDVYASAAFSPFDITPLEEEPSGFDIFWNDAKNELPSLSGNGVELTPYPTDLSPNSDTWILKLPNINGRHAYGYLTIPTDIPGPFPAVLEFPPFGSENEQYPDHTIAELNDIIHLYVSIHNTPPNEEDPNAYKPEYDLNDPNTFYFKQAVTGGIQAIEYIYTRSDFDANAGLGVMGVSQGAGLAVMVAGLDNRVKTLLASNPIGGQLIGGVYGKATGFPKDYILSEGNLKSDLTAQQIENVKYYDAGYFAKRFNGISRYFVGYKDYVCPAAGHFSTFNQLNGTKIITHEIENGHNHEKYYSYPSFIKRFLNPASGNVNSGYNVSAGISKSVPVGKPVNLSGIAENEENYTSSSPPEFTYEWSIIDGPGSVNFSNIKNISTTATFSQVGEYTVQFKAIDKYGLSTSDNDFTTLFDKVIINVLNCTNNDDDGACDFDDCNDTDPSVPKAPGTNCDDGDPDTFGDIIQADGCNCAGTGKIIETACGENGENILIESGEGQITVTSLNGVGFFLKIWPKLGNNLPANQENSVYTGTSEPPLIVHQKTNLEEGDYVIYVQSFDPYYGEICLKAVYVSPSESNSCTDADNDGYCYPEEDCDDNNPNFPASPGSPCDDGNPNTQFDQIKNDGCTCQGSLEYANCDNVQVTVGIGQITINELTAFKEKIKIIEQNTGFIWQLVCDEICSNPQVIQDLPVGTYTIEIEMTGENGDYCYRQITDIAVTQGNSCIDLDGDGVCSTDDCDDTNPVLPATPGTSCDDEDSNTDNDVYLADGCTCQGDVPTTGGGPANCGNIQVTGGVGEITVDGLTAFDEDLEIIGANTNWIWLPICDNNCNDPHIVENLPEGTYNIKVEMFGDDGSYCYFQEDGISVLAGGTGGCTVDADGDGVCATDDCNDTDPNLPATPGTSCDDGDSNTQNDVYLTDGCTCQGDAPTTGGGPANCGNIQVTGGTGEITVDGLTALNEKVSIFGENTNWAWVSVCDNNCNDPHIVANLAAGTYNVKVEMFGDDGSYCYFQEDGIPVSEGGTGGCTADADGDGVCATDDCNDTDPNLPATPGTSCDDGDSNTDNDVYLADGCTCQGEAPTTGGGPANCGNIQVTGGTGEITMDGLTALNEKVSIFGENTNWAWVSVCDNNCNDPHIVANLAAGTYNVKVEMFGDDGSYCYFQEDGIPVSEGGTGSGGGPANCGNIQVTGGAEEITVDGLTALNEKVSVFGENTNWTWVTVCDNNCNDPQVVVNLTAGTYNIKVEMFGDDGSYCYFQEDGISVSAGSNLTDGESQSRSSRLNKLKIQDISVYPNPVKSELFVNLNTFAGEQGILRIINVYGQDVTTMNIPEIPNTPIRIDLGNIGTGMYHLVFNRENKEPIIKKLIVAKVN